MSKAYRQWKERREWGLLHRWPTPKKRFTMRNYRRWKRWLGRHNKGITKSARDIMSSTMPDEIARWVGKEWNDGKN